MHAVSSTLWRAAVDLLQISHFQETADDDQNLASFQ